MVRRGSPVRVRKRALQKRRTSGRFRRRYSVDPGWVYEDAVAAVWAIGADGDQLEAVVSGFECPHRCGVDANDIPAAELADLVVESDLSGAADDDVGLLLFTVPMRRRCADAGAIPQIGDPKMLGVEVLAREPSLDPGRALAHGVLDLLFQIHDRIRAHQFSSLVSVFGTDRQAIRRSTA